MPVYLFSQQFLEDVGARVTGPGGFRFIVQPLASIGLGIRDGLTDARTGQPPYVIAVFFDRDHGRELLQAGFKSILKPYIVGVFIDLIVQWFIFRHIRPAAALLMGFLLIGLPYSLSRGITNRIVARKNQRRGTG